MGGVSSVTHSVARLDMWIFQQAIYSITGECVWIMYTQLCQVVWCIGLVWGASVGWSAEAWQDLSVQAGFCSKRRWFCTGCGCPAGDRLSLCVPVFQYFR
jgi:hypothetical protein